MTSRERSRVAGTSQSTVRSPLKISSWYLTEVTVPETRLQAQDEQMWHLTWTDARWQMSSNLWHLTWHLSLCQLLVENHKSQPKVSLVAGNTGKQEAWVPCGVQWGGQPVVGIVIGSTHKKKQEKNLAGVAQWTECWPANQKVASSIPSQYTCLGCGSGPQ